jgi:type VI secretion system secreted protein Hcp
MAIDIFLVIPENPANPPVEGTAAADQSIAATFPNATVISVSSFELGVENSVSLGSATGGAGAGKVQFDPLIIQKAVDHASPSLFSAASSGRNFQAVQLYLRSSGPATQPFLAYEFRAVLITKIDWSGNSGSQEAAETLTLAYGAVVVAFQQPNPDGSPGPVTQGGWNQVTNTADVQNTLAISASTA